MKTCILIILQILISGLIIAQDLSIKHDSVCLQYLTLKNDNSYKYLKKELIKNKIKNDTLILSIYNTERREVILYLCGGENYNSSLRVFSFTGYLYINEVYILVRDENILNVKDMFCGNNKINCFYYYKDETVAFPAIVVGSKIELNYKVLMKKNNKIIFRRQSLSQS